MKTKITKKMLALPAVATLLCSGSAVNAQTVNDGSMETNSWTAVNFTPDYLTNPAPSPFTYNQSSDGGNYYGLTSFDVHHEAISTTFSGLTVGEDYTLSFFVMNDFVKNNNNFVGATRFVNVSGYAGTADSFNTPNRNNQLGTWGSVSHNFTATDSSGTLTFASGGDFDDSIWAFFDGVSITPTANVPEPSSAALLGFGMLGLLARRKR